MATNKGKPYKIFVVEDNEWYNKLLVHNLSLNPDYEVSNYYNGKECIENLHQKPDLITLDYRLPDMNGIEILKHIKAEDETIDVILISEQEDIEVVVDLLKLGARDYIVKSNDIKERLLSTVHNIRENATLKQEISTLRKEVQEKYDFEKSIIGNSTAIKHTYALIEKAIKTNITVTIYGETGTGKELVAKAIHYNSRYRNKPFVAVNVAALPAELIESELFGHEKGAFTGASFRRIGKFEEAHKGTLFLDEIAEMDIAFQAKLLRALQEKEIVRIGSNQPVQTDCRIVVATNKNLLEEVKKGNFRQDLFYRLFGLPIELPPLRDREKDVLILAKHFVDTFCKDNKLEIKKISKDAQKKLMNYPFPGNIRELRSIMELATTMTNNGDITADDILLPGSDSVSDILSEELTLREYNHKIIDAYLKRYDSNVKLVAEKLDVGMSTIYRMLKEEEQTSASKNSGD
ncbi:MAG: response regulator [Bacteroidetes bacterium]|nr:response regulator [Bacteroidota bacterium]